MGSSGIVIAETKNYRWYLWTGSDAGDHYRYTLKLNKKSNDEEVYIPTSAYYPDTESGECDEAYKELTEEHDARWNYEEMTKEQLAFSDMYERMKRAESAEEHFRRLYAEADELIQKMRNAGELNK